MREFTPEEVSVALELADETIAQRGTYRFWLDVEDARLRGYVCYGPTPMTRGTFDLYWLAVDDAARGAGVGRGLVRHMEGEIHREGARLVRVETSGTEEYAKARAFYAAIGYEVLARIRDFYWPENDLWIFGHYLGSQKAARTGGGSRAAL
jgi:ribosomal protein S18 acetylase RimI-like enzyme